MPGLTNAEWKNFLRRSYERAKYLSNNAATQRQKNEAKRMARMLKNEINWRMRYGL